MRTADPDHSQQVNLSIVTAVVCIALGAVSAAMASLNVAIPDLVRSTHASQTQLEWIIDAYLLVFSVLLLPAGALGDRYGRRKALIVGLIVFGGASAAAMAVSSANELIFLRGLIGLGAAFVMPATLSTITGHVPSRRAHEGSGRLGRRRRRERHLGAAGQRDPPPMVLLAGRLRHQRRPRRRRPGGYRPLRTRVLSTGRAGSRQGRGAVRHGRARRPGLQHHRGSRRRLAEHAHPRWHGGGLAVLAGFVLFERRQRNTLSWTPASSPIASCLRAAFRYVSSSSPSSASPSSRCSTSKESVATARSWPPWPCSPCQPR